MALTWQDRAVLSNLDTGGRRRERVVGAEERTVGAGEGRRAQQTAKIARKFQEHGKNVARMWQEHGNNVARTWQEHGINVARAWQ